MMGQLLREAAGSHAAPMKWQSKEREFLGTGAQFAHELGLRCGLGLFSAVLRR